MSWRVRAAVPEDADRIAVIIRASLGYDIQPERVRERLPMILARPTDRVFTAYREEDGAIGGYVHAADYETMYNGGMKNILALAVDEAYQKQGLGKLLLAAVEGWALACGCEAVRLVSGANRLNAHAFYLHCGYHIRKEQKNFIKYLTAHHDSL